MIHTGKQFFKNQVVVIDKLPTSSEELVALTRKLENNAIIITNENTLPDNLITDTCVIGTIIAYNGIDTPGGYHKLDGSIVYITELSAEFYEWILKYSNYITFTEYETELSNNGYCNKYAFDEENKQIRYPTVLSTIAGTDNIQYYVRIEPAAFNVYKTSDKLIGELVYSLLPLEDAGLHLLDGSLLAADGMYAEFVALLSGLRSDYPGLFITENDWQSSVADYGVCGKFVYDEAAATLRLPKVTGFIEGTLDAAALGSLTEAGLPNIEGSIRTAGSALESAVGAFYTSQKSVTGSHPQEGGEHFNYINFSASRSSPIYGNANTVQPQSIKGYLYIVLSNATKAAIVSDIDNIASDLQLKADIDLGNLSASGKVTCAGLGAPSEYAIEFSTPFSGGTVTAPGNGIFCFSASASGIASIALSSNVIGTSSTLPTAGSLYIYLPVSENTVVTVTYSGSILTTILRFIYANGSVPAA